MSWLKLDDRFHENRKVRALWQSDREALGLHIMALSYCAGNETDGLVDEAFVIEKVPAAGQRKRMLAALVGVGLWREMPAGWEINDYLKFNMSHEKLQAKRDADADRKARGRGTQAQVRADAGDPGSQTPHPVHVESARTPGGFHGESSGPVPSRPVPNLPRDVNDSGLALKVSGADRSNVIGFPDGETSSQKGVA